MELFVIRPHSVIDVITNSSTELFICSTKKTVAQIKEILQGLTLVYAAGIKEDSDEYCEEEYLFENIFGEINV